MNYKALASSCVNYLFKDWYQTYSLEEADFNELKVLVKNDQVIDEFTDYLKDVLQDDTLSDAKVQKVLLNVYGRDKYRYYSVVRPIDLNTYSEDDQKPIKIVNFDDYQNVLAINHKAWGYLDYAKPLSNEEVTDYDLVKEP